jgi:hypothetical protein
VAPGNSGLASASLLIALISGLPLAFCLLPIGGGRAQLILSLMALAPQLFALGLGLRAIYVAERDGRTGGQSLAITGVATAVLTCCLTLMLNIYATRVAS